MEERKRWVREPGLQEYLKLPHGTIHTLRREGQLRAIKIGRAVFFDLDEVDAMMESLRAEQYGEASGVR